MIAELLSLILFSSHSNQELIDIKPQPIVAKFTTVQMKSDTHSTIDVIITSIEKPIPTAAPTPTKQTLHELFQKYSNQYQVPESLLTKIAYCESEFNTQAKNLNYVGLYQFSPNTWSAYRKKMQLDPNPDLRIDAEQSIKTAAYMISVGQVGAWPSCSK